MISISSNAFPNSNFCLIIDSEYLMKYALMTICPNLKVEKKARQYLFTL